MQKFDKRAEKSVIKSIERLVSVFGLRDVAHAVNKWNRSRMIRASVMKERQKLRQRLSEIESKL